MWRQQNPLGSAGVRGVPLKDTLDLASDDSSLIPAVERVVEGGLTAS